jgi:hypothetical protein
VGSLLHLTKLDWDINDAVRMFCRFSDYNGPKHWTALQHLFGYLKYTLDDGLILRGSSSIPYTGLVGWSDATWAPGQSQDLRGVSGRVLAYRGNIFHATSKTQSSIARSSCESELVAMSDAAYEMEFCIRVLNELGENVPRSAPLFVDSQSALALVSRPFTSSRSRHLNVRRLAISDLVDEGVVAPTWRRTSGMIADSQTKALGRHLVAKFSPLLRNWVPFDVLPESM